MHKDTLCMSCALPISVRALEKEITSLKAELKQKDEKLSEFQNGLPIEKAKTDGTVYFYRDMHDQPWVLAFDGRGFVATHAITGEKSLMHPRHNIHPLPSTETKEGE